MENSYVDEFNSKKKTLDHKKRWDLVGIRNDVSKKRANIEATRKQEKAKREEKFNATYKHELTLQEGCPEFNKYTDAIADELRNLLHINVYGGRDYMRFYVNGTGNNIIFPCVVVEPLATFQEDGYRYENVDANGNPILHYFCTCYEPRVLPSAFGIRIKIYSESGQEIKNIVGTVRNIFSGDKKFFVKDSKYPEEWNVIQPKFNPENGNNIKNTYCFHKSVYTYEMVSDYCHNIPILFPVYTHEEFIKDNWKQYRTIQYIDFLYRNLDNLKKAKEIVRDQYASLFETKSSIDKIFQKKEERILRKNVINKCVFDRNAFENYFKPVVSCYQYFYERATSGWPVEKMLREMNHFYECQSQTLLELMHLTGFYTFLGDYRELYQKKYMGDKKAEIKRLYEASLIDLPKIDKVKEEMKVNIDELTYRLYSALMYNLIKKMNQNHTVEYSKYFFETQEFLIEKIVAANDKYELEDLEESLSQKVIDQYNSDLKQLRENYEGKIPLDILDPEEAKRQQEEERRQREWEREQQRREEEAAYREDYYPQYEEPAYDGGGGHSFFRDVAATAMGNDIANRMQERRERKAREEEKIKEDSERIRREVERCNEVRLHNEERDAIIKCNKERRRKGQPELPVPPRWTV